MSISDNTSNVVCPNLITRIQTLKALAEHPLRVMPFKFRGSNRDMPVVSVRISLPVYRVGNRRTKTLQEEYLANHPELGQDFFTCDEDSIAVQSAQNDILCGLITEKDLLDVFSNPKVQQDEPIICTRQGVVVNGNRRLCAWRKLFQEDAVKYNHYESVEVMLLPEDTEEPDINNIERDLQIKRSIKSEYSWHARANMIRLDFERVNSYEEIKQMYDMQRQEIEVALECYKYAKGYLASIGKDGQWSLVDKQEYAFQKIVKEKKKLHTIGEQKIFEACAAAVLQVRNKAVGDRRYDVIPQIAQHIKPIIEVLKRDIPTVSNPTQSVDDPFDMVARNSDVDIYRLEQACRNPANVEKTVELLTTVINAQNTHARDARATHLLLEDMTRISTEMITAKNRDLDDRQEDLQSVKNQIESIMATCKYIQEWVLKHETRA